MSFISDNLAGASPTVLRALAAANDGFAPGYGADDWTARTEALFSELFERKVAVSLVASGTAANALGLASLVSPWGAVLCHRESHVAEDECGAPEFYSNGAKLIGLSGAGNKLTPATVLHQLALMRSGFVNHVQPQALSLTQSTECGLVYTADEITALKRAVEPRGLKIHMDGARFANAVAALGCTPAEITWKAGVDVLSFGGTKNGAWAAEAVIFFDPDDASEMPWRRKRAGHTLSKGRFLGAQFEALLADGHWLALARHANAMARRLAQIFRHADIRLAWPCQANAVFPILTEEQRALLMANGVGFLSWTDTALPPETALRPGEAVCRFVTSFATQSPDVERVSAVLNAENA